MAVPWLRRLVEGHSPQIGNSVATFRDNLQRSRSLRSFLFGLLDLEDVTDRLSRNVGTELPVCAA